MFQSSSRYNEGMLQYNPHSYWVLEFISVQGQQQIKSLDQPHLAELVWQIITEGAPAQEPAPDLLATLAAVGLWDAQRHRYLSVEALQIHIYTALKNYGLRHFVFRPHDDLSMFKVLWSYLKSPEQAKQAVFLASPAWRQLWQKIGLLAPAALIAPRVYCYPELKTSLLEDIPYLQRLETDPALEFNPQWRIESLPEAHDFYTPSALRAFPAGQQLLWVTRPDYQIEMPVLLKAGEPWPPVSTEALDAKERQIWRAADLLLRPRESPYGPLQAQLQARHYCHMPKLISPHLLGALRSYYREKYRAGYFQLRDEFVKERDSIHNEPLMQLLHQSLTRAVNQLVPEAVKASYCYLAIYREGAVLPRHIDRSLCRWNLSVVLNLEPEKEGQEVWPIYLEIEPGRPEAVYLEIGDGVLYQGTDYYHWREALPVGQRALVCFFHFVPADYQGFLF